jgi:hypothetical protein
MTGTHRFDNQRTRTLLGLAVVAISVVCAVALAGFSSAGTSPTAVGSPSQAQYGNPKPAKVTICHHTRSKKKPLVTIRVAASAVKAHLKHGDTLGRCSATQIKHAKKIVHAKKHGK